MKTLTEINDILTTAGADPADLTQIIADVTAAKRASDVGIIADLTQQIADADTAHHATLARMKEDAEKALKTLEAELTGRLAAEKTQAEEIATAAANAASNALESLRAQLLEKHAAEMQAAEERFDKAKADLQECKDLGESQDEANHFTIRTLSKERDDARAQLVAREEAQVKLAQNFLENVKGVQDALASAALRLAGCEPALAEAFRPAREKAEARRQEDLAAAEALVLKLKGEQ